MLPIKFRGNEWRGELDDSPVVRYPAALTFLPRVKFLTGSSTACAGGWFSSVLVREVPCGEKMSRRKWQKSTHFKVNKARGVHRPGRNKAYPDPALLRAGRAEAFRAQGHQLSQLAWPSLAGPGYSITFLYIFHIF